MSVSQALIEAVQNSLDIDHPYAASGGTFALNGLPLPTAGFYVGGAKPELILASRLISLDVADIERFVQSAGTPYVGWWVDEETGKIHIDAVNWFQEEFAAGRVGRERKEKAIWDIANERELRLAYVEGE